MVYITILIIAAILQHGLRIVIVLVAYWLLSCSMQYNNVVNFFNF